MKRLLAAVLFAGLALFISAGPAAAHDVLVGSDPPTGASLATGPANVTLNFDLPVRPGFTAMTVVGPDGNSWQDGSAVVDGNSVSVKVRPLGPAGKYQVGYRIVSDDGHPVTGSIDFTLTTAGTGTPASQGTGTLTPDTTSAATQDSGGTPAWPWILGAVALVGVGVVIALRVGRG